MKWTKKLPNKPGLYWYKSESSQGDRILRVVKYGNDDNLYAYDEEYNFVIGDDDKTERWCYIIHPK